MASSISSFADKLAAKMHKTKSKYRHDNKKSETWGVKSKDCKCCIEYTNVKVDLIEYKCLCCNRNYQKKFNEYLKNRFANIYRFFNHDINRFMIGKYSAKHYYLRKERGRYYLNIEDFTDEDHTHDTVVCNTMICIFEVIHYNFRNMSCEIYGLDPVHFLSAPRLACQAALKMTKLKLENWKGMENYRDIKLITMEAGKKNLVSKPSYDTTKLFFRYFISNSSEKNWHTQE